MPHNGGSFSFRCLQVPLGLLGQALRVAMDAQALVLEAADKTADVVDGADGLLTAVQAAFKWSQEATAAISQHIDGFLSQKLTVIIAGALQLDAELQDVGDMKETAEAIAEGLLVGIRTNTGVSPDFVAALHRHLEAASGLLRNDAPQAMQCMANQVRNLPVLAAIQTAVPTLEMQFSEQLLPLVQTVATNFEVPLPCPHSCTCSSSFCPFWHCYCFGF